MSDLDLAELERLEADATPGPWRAGYVEREHVFCAVGASMAHERVLLRLNTHFPRNNTDSELIAALRNAAPQLIADAKRLRDIVEALEFLDVYCRVDLVGQARHLPCAPANVIALARELGWSPAKEGKAT